MTTTNGQAKIGTMMFEKYEQKMKQAKEDKTLFLKWIQGWIENPPRSYATGEAYGFFNSVFCLDKGGYYITKQSAEKLGGKIKDSELKNSYVIFMSMRNCKTIVDEETGEEKLVWYGKMGYRFQHVYHYDQTEGVPMKKSDKLENERMKPLKDMETEQFIQKILKSENVWKFENVNNGRCVYKPLSDTVEIPPIESFISMEEYYASLFHEFIHATGHKSRTNRISKAKFKVDMDSEREKYAYEELCAEFGAMFMLNLLGLETEATENNSIAYIDGWHKQIKEDPEVIYKSIQEAEQAVMYMIDMAQSA